LSSRQLGHKALKLCYEPTIQTSYSKRSLNGFMSTLSKTSLTCETKGIRFIFSIDFSLEVWFGSTHAHWPRSDYLWSCL